MKTYIIGLVTVIFTELVALKDGQICWYKSPALGQFPVHHKNLAGNNKNDSYSHRKVEGSNQTCTKNANYCFALWKESHKNESKQAINIIAQGCWESSGKKDCENVSCINRRKPPKALNDTNFCCCSGNFCNGNITQMYGLEQIEDLSSLGEQQVEKVHFSVPIAFIFSFIVLLLLLLPSLPALFILIHKYEQSKNEDVKPCSNSVHLMENCYKSQNPDFNFENFKIEKLIGQGKFGSIWKGYIGSEAFAVKIFKSHHKQYFYNERDIYSMQLMSHSSLLSYFGYDERIASDGSTEYMLFLTLIPNGSLQDFLFANVVNWDTFCKMALTISTGLAYLHSRVQMEGKTKPCITHRDLNSKNILVKNDLSCVICDLGFATKINGSKYYYNGEEQNAEVKSINEVGSLRYMSPEVLEGAVNLRDCETALKQIDVYALGLILWEISTRCTQFYPNGMDCSPYRLPFEAEIGHPTIEQMQVLVCKHKARPLFPDLWRDAVNIRTVRETIEDCWDQDAEARLTALCVEERFRELATASQSQKIQLHSMSGASPGLHANLPPNDYQNSKGEESCRSDSTNDTCLIRTTAKCKNSNYIRGLCQSVQPHQGRNPCKERNLMLQDEIDFKSGTLIDKSAKSNKSSLMETSLNLLNPNSSNSRADTNPNLVNTSFAEQSEPILRVKAQIPFVENVRVHSTRKQLNLPICEGEGKKSKWRIFHFLTGREKGSSLVTEYSPTSNLIANENCLNLSTPTSVLEPKFDTRVSLYNGKAETKINGEGIGNCSSTASHVKPPIGDTLLLRKQNNERPDTLTIPLAKNIDFLSS